MGGIWNYNFHFYTEKIPAPKFNTLYFQLQYQQLSVFVSRIFSQHRDGPKCILYTVNIYLPYIQINIYLPLNTLFVSDFSPSISTCEFRISTSVVGT